MMATEPSVGVTGSVAGSPRVRRAKNNASAAAVAITAADGQTGHSRRAISNAISHVAVIMSVAE